MYIPPELVEQVKESIDIVEYIGQFVDLKKKARSFFGLCPFHSEKTPSFSVNPSRQIYNCFGCGTKGNIFSFIIKYENIEFQEAVRIIAERSNITLPDTPSIGTARRFDQLYQINKMAAILYYRNLWSGIDKENEDYLNNGIQYLHDRGFLTTDVENNVLKQFKLGYASKEPENWLYNQLKEKFDDEIIGLSGLVHTDTKKDRFSNVLVFPIIDHRDRVVSLSGRYLDVEDTTKKYNNISKTLIYKKNNVLYGINETKKAIKSKKETIVVEGYFDLIRMYSSGYKNIVATMGTEISDLQIKMINRFADTVILIRDNDIGGNNSIKKTSLKLIDAGLGVKITTLPDGEDPDSLILKSPDKLQSCINESVYFITFWIDKIKEEFISTPQKKAKKIKQIISQLNIMKDELLKSMYIKQISEKLDIKASLIMPDKTVYAQMTREEKLKQKIFNIRNKIRIVSSNDIKLKKLLKEHLDLTYELQQM